MSSIISTHKNQQHYRKEHKKPQLALSTHTHTKLG